MTMRERAIKPGAQVAALLIVIVPTMLKAQERKKTILETAKHEVGNVVTLCGRVVAYQCHRPERTSLLALEEPIDGPGVSVAVSPEHRGVFGPLFESRYLLQDVCATGQIEKRKNRYLIAVTSPAQLEVRTGLLYPSIFGSGIVSPCDDGVQLPKLVKEVRPEYTEAAMNARITGDVLVEAVVLTDGSVGRMRVGRSLDSKHGLDDQALKAVSAWRFAPGTLQGRPVPVLVTVALSFNLRNAR